MLTLMVLATKTKGQHDRRSAIARHSVLLMPTSPAREHGWNYPRKYKRNFGSHFRPKFVGFGSREGSHGLRTAVSLKSPVSIPRELSPGPKNGQVFLSDKILSVSGTLVPGTWYPPPGGAQEVPAYGWRAPPPTPPNGASGALGGLRPPKPP